MRLNLAVLFSEGFEGTLAGWTVWNTPEIQTTIKHGGLSALKCKEYDVAFKQISPVNQITVEQWVYIDTLPPVSADGLTQAQPIHIQTATYGEIAVVYIDNNEYDGLRVAVYCPLGQGRFVDYTFQPNTWYKFKLDYNANVSGGWILSINDVEVINVSGIDTSSLLPELVFMATLNYTGNIYTDDVTVSSTVTPPPTTYPVNYSSISVDGAPISVPLTFDSQQLASGQATQLPAGTITISVPSEVTV